MIVAWLLFGLFVADQVQRLLPQETVLPNNR